MGEPPKCGRRGKSLNAWRANIELETRQLLKYCVASGTDRKSIPPNTAEAFLKSLQEYLEAANGFQFPEGTKSLPYVKLTYIGLYAHTSFEWTEDCWMTPDGKVYIPAKAKNSLAYSLSEAYNHETLPPPIPSDGERRNLETRYIRFFHDHNQGQLFIEVPDIGRGLAGIEFGWLGYCEPKNFSP